jgi:benzoyl-CoA reductase subunit C
LNSSKTFRKSLSRFSGREIADADLAGAVRAYNELRAKVRELYDLRKPDPPLICGAGITRALLAVMSLPVDESIELLDVVILIWIKPAAQFHLNIYGS